MSVTQKGNRRGLQQPRLRVLAGQVALAIAIGAAGAPSVSLAASNEELLKKIEDLQREMDSLKSQVKSQATKTEQAAQAAQAASTAATGKGPSWPSGFEVSLYGVGHLSGESIDIDQNAIPGGPTSGTVRGISHAGARVESGAKVFEVDPRTEPGLCFGVGERPRRITGGMPAIAATGLAARGRRSGGAPVTPCA